MDKKKLPIGIDDFEKMIKEDFYYVDKTDFISEFLDRGGNGKVFTRPGHFGKTVNMSMLKSFFSISGDKSVFDGLKISKETTLCEKYMGKYPVISISLKEVGASFWEEAYENLIQVVRNAVAEFPFLMEDSSPLTEYDKEEYQTLLHRNMSAADVVFGLRELMRLLATYYGTKVIVLIDDYDIPFAKAFENGYYDAMNNLLRPFLDLLISYNENLEFTLLTGRMEIADESTFYGLNLVPCLDTYLEYAECFGFNETEVRDLLEYYDLSAHQQAVKDWCGGYLFGESEIYCPWDVVNYCNWLLENKKVQHMNEWRRSDIFAIQKIVQSSQVDAKSSFKWLVADREITKSVKWKFNYPDLFQTNAYIWSRLFVEGYLISKGDAFYDYKNLAIPNLVIREIIQSYMEKTGQKYSKADASIYRRLCKKGDEQKAIQIAEQKMQQCIREGKTKPSEMCPYTTVHELVGEIREKIEMNNL